VLAASLIIAYSATPQELSTPDSYSGNRCHHKIDISELDCNFGAQVNATNKVLLVGDSHAAQHLWALQELALILKFELISLTSSGCPSISRDLLGTFNEHCKSRQTQLRKFLSEQNGVVILISNMAEKRYPQFTEYSDKVVSDGYVRFINDVMPSNKVIVVLDTPYPNFDVPKCLRLSRSLGEIVNCDIPNTSSSVTRSLERALMQADIEFLNPRPILCPKDCKPLTDGKSIYRDESHLSRSGSLLLRDALGKLLREELNTKED